MDRNLKKLLSYTKRYLVATFFFTDKKKLIMNVYVSKYYEISCNVPVRYFIIPSMTKNPCKIKRMDGGYRQ